VQPDLQRICDENVKLAGLSADYLSIGRHHRDRTPTVEAEIASPSRTAALSGGSAMDELHEKHVEIDERWLSEWFEFGFAELSSYLAKHAAFDDFLHKHEID
jgi:hypothetical protein